MIDFEVLSRGLGIPINLTLIITGIFLIVLLFAINKTNKATPKFFMGVLIVLIVSSFTVSINPLMEQVSDSSELINWKTDYVKEAKRKLPDYNLYISNTMYYDYSDETITKIANDISRDSKSPKQAVERALDYVYNNIKYVAGELDLACIDGKAPEILASGKGQCDTQSIVLISILRRIGIAAKPVGGCIMVSDDCGIQSMFINSFERIINSPKYSSIEDIGTGNLFSRTKLRLPRADLTSRSGGLHAWVTAWIPNYGWLNLEATTGKIVDTKCYNYHIEIFPEEDQKEDICVSRSWQYAQGCMNNEISILNKFGLGLVTEVEP